MILRSLRLRLIAYFLLAMLIPLGAVSVYGNFFTTRTLSEGALERSTYQVNLQAETILSAIQQVESDAVYLGALRSLAMLTRQTDPIQTSLWREEVAQDFLVLASVRPMYARIQLIDSQGNDVLGVESNGQRVFISTEFHQHSTTPYFSETIRLQKHQSYLVPYRAPDGIPYLQYAMRIDSGVLLIELHVGWLLRTLPESPMGDIWAMIDQAGQPLVYPEGFNLQTIQEDIPRLLSTRQGSFETKTGVMVFATLYPVGQTPNQLFWVLFRHTPKEVLYESVGDFYDVSRVLVGISALTAVLVALLISGVVVAPIKQLQAMTVQFGQDGIAPAMPVDLPHDELGELSRAFVETARELESKRRQEHRLIERLMHAQEEERKLIAYDLHDGLIQQIVGARFYFTKCHDIYDLIPPDIRDNIEHGCHALSNAIVETRRIVEGLRPGALDDLGLMVAIQELAEQSAILGGWSLSLDLHALKQEPEKTIATTLYRITQEALSNICKHAQAKHVTVSLHNGNHICLSIEDDGIGFDWQATHNSGQGLGITTMQERASLIGGKCLIQTKQQQGTMIRVTVPLSLQPHNEHSHLLHTEGA